MIKALKSSNVILVSFSLLTALVIASKAVAVSAAPPPSDLNLVVVTSGLAQPIFVTNANDGSGRLFIAQQNGQIRIFKNGNLLSSPYLNIGGGVVSNFTGSNSELGLLGVAFDPNYSSNGYFYITYTASNNDPTFIYTITLARYRVSSGNSDLADTSSGTVLLSIPKKYGNHNGGMIAFGPDGYLYMSTGDGGSGGDPDNNAQDLNTSLGKMLRLDVTSTPPPGKTYTIPSTNPFYGNVDPNIKKEIWAYGLRNAWRFSFDHLTNDLFIGDVGQGAREEINFQPGTSIGGENYGWRVMEGSICYNPSSGCNQTGKVLPATDYDHSLGCSVTGGYVYRGTKYPSLYGYYFYGDFCTGRLFSLYRNSGSAWESTQLVDTPYNISTFGEDEQGELYLADYTGGTIYSISHGPALIISGNTGMAGEAVNYTGGSTTTDDTGSYSITVPSGWIGTVTPSSSCYTYTPPSRSYTNIASNQFSQNYTPSALNPTCADVNVDIGGVNRGDYTLPSGQSIVKKYTLDGGPVVISSNNGVGIIASLNQWRRPSPTGGWTGVAQSMALPVGQISNSYAMPYYNGTDSTLYNAVLMANVDTVPRTITVTIGGAFMGSYLLGPSDSRFEVYNVTGGPLVVSSVTGAKIVASLYELKRAGATGEYNGQSEMMGLPTTQLSNKYLIPIYFGMWPGYLDASLAFANVDTFSTTVDVTIAGVSRGTYVMPPSTSMVVRYALDGGPVEISSNNGAKIVASLNQWRRPTPTGGWTGVAQSMALPYEKIWNSYVIPRFNGTDSTLYNAVLMANVDNVARTITVKIGSTVVGSYLLGASDSRFEVYNVADGPIVVSSDVGAKIVASLYELKRAGATGEYNGQSEMMGLPISQLSTEYLIPIYFGMWPGYLDASLYIAVP